jgi:large subunit ribosomal protein L22
METFAIHKDAMIAPRKARMTMDLVRGKDVQTAQGILENTNTKASRLILKV